MSYGIIEYNEDGMPKCEICGNFYHRILPHARQKHDINEKEYKKAFGLDLKKGICSKESAERTRVKTLDNYEKCIGKNLIKNGINTRFYKGFEGRPKEKVSEQTLIRLKERMADMRSKQKTNLNK